jgi:hypothetical protein
MSYRRFTDRGGHQWEVRDRSSSEWVFEPVGGNPHLPTRVRPPSYEKDPFELSEEELQGLLGDGGPERSRPRESPFKD